MHFFTFALVAVVAVSANQIGDHSQKLCEPDQVYREYCNTCVCEAEGCGAICSQNWCPPGMFKENGMLNVTYDFVIDKSKGNLTEIAVVCEPHKFFAYYCNTCVCNANGTRSICSNKRCAKNYNIDGSINNPRICRPYSDYIRDCNQCYCSHDGMHAMCTRDKCEPTTCNPGKSFKEGEFDCTCNETGDHKTCYRSVKQ